MPIKSKIAQLRYYLLLVISSILLLSACNQEEFTQDRVKQLIVVDANSSTAKVKGYSQTTVPVGSITELKAVAVLSTGDMQDVSDSVSWASKTPSVATVDDTGKVRGLAKGEATIVVEKNGVTADYKLTVTDSILRDIQVSPPKVSLVNGTSQQVQAKGMYSDGSSMDITPEVEWDSSTDGIVSISSTGVVTAVKSGSTTLTATSKENNVTSMNNISVDVSTEMLVSIKISPQTLTLPLGLSGSLDAVGVYSDNSTMNLNNDVVWSSDDIKVATVDQTGGISTLSQGSANIDAISRSTGITNTKSAIVNVVTATLDDILLSPDTVSLVLGYTANIKAQGNYDDGSQSDVTEQVETWTSSDPTIVFVDDKGVITGKGVGSAQISAEINGVKSSNSVDVKVSSAVLDSIDLTPLIIDVSVGEFKRVSALAHFSDGNDLDVSSSVVWSSSAADVAIVDDLGLVYGVKQGQSEITAELNGIKSNVSSHVDVKTGALTEIVLPQTVDVVNGDKTQLNAIGLYSDGSTEDISDKVSWLTLDESIATINTTGVIEGVSVGTTNIIASLNGVSNTVDSIINVLDASLLDIKLNTSNTSITAGYTTQVTAKGMYSNQTEYDFLPEEVYWLSDDIEVATVNNKGLVKGLKVGTVQITATSDGVTNSVPLAISVTAAKLETLTLTAIDAALPKGLTTSMEAQGAFSDGSSMTIDNSKIKWSSSNSNIATVDQSGVVNAIGKGKTDIVAEKDGVRASYEIEVLDKSIMATKVEYHTWRRGEKEYVLAYNDNQARQLHAKYIYSDGSEERINTSDLRWIWLDGNLNGQSNNERMVKITDTGMITLNTAYQSAWADIAAVDIKNNLTSPKVRFNAKEVTYDSAKCEGLNRGYDDQSSNICISLFTAGDNWIISPLSKAMTEQLGLTSGVGYTVGSMPDGGDTAYYGTLIEQENLCIKMNSIKAFGIDYWLSGNDNSIGKGIGVEAYNELFSEHGSLVNKWPSSSVKYYMATINQGRYGYAYRYYRTDGNGSLRDQGTDEEFSKSYTGCVAKPY